MLIPSVFWHLLTYNISTIEMEYSEAKLNKFTRNWVNVLTGLPSIDELSWSYLSSPSLRNTKTENKAFAWRLGKQYHQNDPAQAEDMKAMQMAADLVRENFVIRKIIGSSRANKQRLRLTKIVWIMGDKSGRDTIISGREYIKDKRASERRRIEYPRSFTAGTTCDLWNLLE